MPLCGRCMTTLVNRVIGRLTGQLALTQRTLASGRLSAAIEQFAVHAQRACRELAGLAEALQHKPSRPSQHEQSTGEEASP